MNHALYWCAKVLPLVYDDSLSYYENLCKIFTYVSNLKNDNSLLLSEIESLKEAIDVINKWIEDFDTSYIKTLVETYIATMIFLEINDDGYIVYNIPDSWKSITFNTTGLDIILQDVTEYGRLVLSY